MADPWCHYDFIDQPTGVTILKRDNHRPDVIILTIWKPGSLDDAILGLARGLTAHKLSSRSYSISPDRMKREIDATSDQTRPTAGSTTRINGQTQVMIRLDACGDRARQ